MYVCLSVLLNISFECPAFVGIPLCYSVSPCAPGYAIYVNYYWLWHNWERNANWCEEKQTKSSNSEENLQIQMYLYAHVWAAEQLPIYLFLYVFMVLVKKKNITARTVKVRWWGFLIDHRWGNCSRIWRIYYQPAFNGAKCPQVPYIVSSMFYFRLTLVLYFWTLRQRRQKSEGESVNAIGDKAVFSIFLSVLSLSTCILSSELRYDGK